MQLINELRRRNVFRVAAAYAVVAWLIVQVGDVAADNLGFPEWFMPMLFVLLGLGFPIALFLAWAFELTPEGMKREKEIAPGESIAPRTGQKLDRLIIVVLALVLGVLLAERFWPDSADMPIAVTDPPISVLPPGETNRPALSIAVLPFVNVSSSPEQEYFSDGITEEIINTLVRRTDLSVAARTSVFAFKGDNRNVSEIGRSLNVSHVIEGSVRSAGDQVRITAQLIGVDDGFHLWSDSYDRQLTNIFAVQEEIAASVAEALSQALMPAGDAPRHATTDPQTYDLYLQARALLRLRREEQLTRAAELLAEATERDPRFAPAWATAAQVADVSERHDDAVEFAERALVLDPRNVDALTALGAAYRDTYRWEDAEAKLLQALELDPESSELLEDYAEFLGATGRTEAMLDVARRGWLIDPYLPPLAAVYAEALMTAGRSEESLQVLDDLNRVANMPDWIQSYRFAALREVAPDERLIELVADLPPPVTPLRALIIDALRDPENSTKVDAVAEAVSRLDPSDFSPDTMISTYALLHLGRPEPVLDFQIRQAREWIPTELEWIHAPLFDELRALPRFAELMEISRLPEYWDANGWPDYCRRTEQGVIQCQ